MTNLRNGYANNYFRKVLVPVFYGCDSSLGLQVARSIAGDTAVLLSGLVGIEEGDSLSTGALHSQELRRKLRELVRGTRMRGRASVVVTHNLWHYLLQIIQEERPELLVLDWPCHLELLKIPSENALRDLPCDVALVRGPIKEELKQVLVPIRGGPHAELALRISLAFSRGRGAHSTALHLFPNKGAPHSEAPFRGLSGVIQHIPELEKLEMVSDHPAETLLALAPGYDLIVMGATARTGPEQVGLGDVADRLMEKSPIGVVVVKTHRTMDPEAASEEAGRQAISVLVDRWFAQNTYNSGEFSDLETLVRLKNRQKLTISLALPSLNEQETVGEVIQTIKGELMDRLPLLDEIVLMDSSSEDRTRQIAQEMGIPVRIHQQVLPAYGARSGKGEALWKSLFVTRGDIVLWIDTDIVNIHPRFVYGLVGPLLANPGIAFVKGYYQRPIRVGERVIAGGGGRVTELAARPLINLFFPELSGLIQPLSGEYGGRRSLLERLPFFSGYGVEIGLLIDVLKVCGLDAIAQVDLQERVHHNQPLEALSKMSFAIIQAVTRKLDTYYGYSALEDVNKTMKLIRYETGRLYLDVEEIAELERPPMTEIPEYRELRDL